MIGSIYIATRDVYESNYRAIIAWREIAISKEVGLSLHELEDFAPAFEHEQMDAAKLLLQ